MNNIESVRSVAELISAMDTGAEPTFVFFWSNQPRQAGAIDAACLSQWWPSTFESDGQRFASAEQYMMWSKALLFGDAQSADSILSAQTPARIKKLGRQVRNFDESMWEAARWDVVVRGSVAKFTANAELRQYLLGTVDQVLVEASPLDRIWGIGLSEDSPDAKSPRSWPGLNLLGFALMEARARIAQTG